MKLLNNVVGLSISLLVEEKVEDYVKSYSIGQYDESHISHLNNVSILSFHLPVFSRLYVCTLFAIRDQIMGKKTKEI